MGWEKRGFETATLRLAPTEKMAGEGGERERVSTNVWSLLGSFEHCSSFAASKPAGIFWQARGVGYWWGAHG